MSCTSPPVWEETTLAGDARAPAAARQFVAEVAAGCPDDVVADARLLVSELASNVVRHGRRGRVRVRAAVTDRGGVRVEVANERGGFLPRARSRTEEQVSGWGLEIVDRLATRWGVDRGTPTVVWFEVGHPEPA